MQIYAYSMLTFVLCAVFDCVFMKFERIKWLCLALSVAVSCYYTFKETYLDAKKLLTLAMYKRLAMMHVA